MSRRMFSPQIIDSDAFLDMSPSAQNLYFHLGMRADDDGFIGNPKKIMRVVGSNDDDLKVLLLKRFLLSFNNGIVVVKHWLIHNLIRADLYKETQYKKEKATLGLNENGAYTELRDGVFEIKKVESPEWLKKRRKDMRTESVPLTALRLGKDRLGKEKKEEKISTPFSLKEKLEKMKEDKRIHIRILALFFFKRKIDLSSKEELSEAIKRHSRSAVSVSKFDKNKIFKAIEECVAMEKDGIKWTLETCLKVLTK